MVLNPAPPVATGALLEGSRPTSITTPGFLSHRLLNVGKAGRGVISRPCALEFKARNCGGLYLGNIPPSCACVAVRQGRGTLE